MSNSWQIENGDNYFQCNVLKCRTLVKLNDQRPKSHIDWRKKRMAIAWRIRPEYIISIRSLVLFRLFYVNFFNYTDFRHLMKPARKLNNDLHPSYSLLLRSCRTSFFFSSFLRFLPVEKTSTRFQLLVSTVWVHTDCVWVRTNLCYDFRPVFIAHKFIWIILGLRCLIMNHEHRILYDSYERKTNESTQFWANLKAEERTHWTMT